MTDNTKADEYLQEQLVEQGDVSSMRYIGDDYTRIVTIREDRLLNIITAYTNKQIEAVLDRLESKAFYDPSGTSPLINPREIQAERIKLKVRRWKMKESTKKQLTLMALKGGDIGILARAILELEEV